MKIRYLKLLNSFRGKILLSFFSFIAVLLIWIGIYFTIKTKEQDLQNFSNQLTVIQNRFFESNNSLQSFILSGFHQPEFYKTEKQKDIDTFQSYLEKNLVQVNLVKKEARRNNIDIDTQLDRLSAIGIKLIDSVKVLKRLYLERGFKDFGVEGNMRLYAHMLEDSSLIAPVNILQLRRHEKDFLIRGDMLYAKQFTTLIDQLTESYPKGSFKREVLDNYKYYFNELVRYTHRIGINTDQGVYYDIQHSINALDSQYASIRVVTNHEVTRLQEKMKTILICVSASLIIIVILLSLFLSKVLTRDIKELNQRVFAFINSRFRDETIESADQFAPKIKEVERLNKAFLHLKKSLKYTLDNLEKSYEEAKKSSEYKSTFLANMSHEIRTPLNGITGMVHILKHTELSGKQLDYLTAIDFSANHLLELINMLLDYSKIESGKMELENIPVDLKGDINKVIKIFEYKIKEKGLQLNLTYEADSKQYIFGDPLRLQQIFINLINNAIKFTESGSIHIKVIEQEPRKPLCQTLRFEIEDTGIGISPDKIDSLFEAFKQADTSITRNFGGTGLGLTISDQLVKMMGGKLEVTSEFGKGTAFFFTLDFPLGAPIPYKPNDVVNDAADFSGTSILLVEDNLINQQVISLMLKRYHVTIELAENGQQACEMYAQNDYDLVLMDIQMPVMDGLQATSLIRQSAKYAKTHTPIVAITANAFKEDREMALAVGMDDFLCKPIKPQELEGILAKYHLAASNIRSGKYSFPC